LLIVFDLDDTLVRTSECITPILLERCLLRMVNKGFEVTDSHQALVDLKRINKESANIGEALEKFLNIKQQSPDFIAVAQEEVHNFILDMPIFPLESAIEILYALKKRKHILCLVTIGKEILQRQKLEKAGIDPILFSKIIVSEDKNKQPHYEKLLAEFNYSPSQVLVCGDRVSIDLEPAIRLDCKTVHILSGRGLSAKERASQAKVTYRISSLIELDDLEELR
jgi:putative hydrolase of the HAD superfamily